MDGFQTPWLDVAETKPGVFSVSRAANFTRFVIAIKHDVVL